MKLTEKKHLTQFLKKNAELKEKGGREGEGGRGSERELFLKIKAWYKAPNGFNLIGPFLNLRDRDPNRNIQALHWKEPRQPSFNGFLSSS